MSTRSPTSLFRDFDRLDVVALTMIEGFGPARTRAHLERIRHDARRIDDGFPFGVFVAAEEKARRSLEVADRIGARCLIDGDPEYPQGLHALENPPVALWTMGDASVAHHPLLVAIVGTRDCSMYGERVARDFAMAFAQAGAIVVSGMARGIDGVAHRAALAANAPTIAVLGTGVDVPYPVSHRGLHAQIRQQGVVISESAPGSTARPGCFPRRNRIIAALGRVTIVVEAGAKSGALSTADHAMGLSRMVGVVPGPIDSPRSLGSNMLMRDGGHPLTSIADALAMIGLEQNRHSLVEPEAGDERTVWRALAKPAADFDVLCARTGLPGRLCFEVVTALEMRGLVECSVTGELRRR